jgi:hypothetical protein
MIAIPVIVLVIEPNDRWSGVDRDMGVGVLLARDDRLRRSRPPRTK